MAICWSNSEINTIFLRVLEDTRSDHSIALEFGRKLSGTILADGQWSKTLTPLLLELGQDYIEH